jgi:hypothetical protein
MAFEPIPKPGEATKEPEIRKGDQFEEPYEPLRYDTTRYVPDEWNQRLVKITNALMDRARIVGHNQAAICKLGTRKGDDYKDTRSTQYELEAEMDALKYKYDAVKAILYQKSNEMRHLSSQ